GTVHGQHRWNDYTIIIPDGPTGMLRPALVWATPTRLKLNALCIYSHPPKR
ncbi:unnamed protein product, partial [Callosobruchus maculatus]